MDGADWRPTAGPAALSARAVMLSSVRAFFASRGVLEVETPVLSRAATSDPALESLATCLTGSAPMYLHTSPEFAMKRLLAAGCGDIFQVCKVFRDGETGRLHNPEFTMLEWYRADFDMRTLMREVAELLGELLQNRTGRGENAAFISYRELYLANAGIDPLQTDSRELAKVLTKKGVVLPAGRMETNELLDLVMSAVILPGLPPDVLTFVFDYPASQASLAVLNSDDTRTARRFEAVLGGMELCNGFEELRDTDEQRSRFQREADLRRALGLPDRPIDERLLAALAAGMPACSGVALGLDRVLMLALGAEHIAQVLTFPVERA